IMEKDLEYWASKDRELIGGEITSKVDDYYRAILQNGQVALWQRSYNQYYRGFITGGELLRGGNSAQLTKMSVNHYRNLIRHILSMTTSQKAVFEPRAINNDYET
ncbi:MAG: hypothetical protein ACK55I_13795, partial [bacterium]